MKKNTLCLLALGILFAASTALPKDQGDHKKAKKSKNVAVMFVGHGEPAKAEDGDIPITFPDGTPFGPHAVELGVPEEFQYTEWAAAYEEIATAMAYIFGDINGNGIEHEVAIVPHGDVPGFFSWEAYHSGVFYNYSLFGNYSPHNKLIKEHVDSLDIKVKGAKIDVYLALLDEVPRIGDIIHQIAQGDYDELVVIPMLVSKSTHTDEITDQIADFVHLIEDVEITVGEPFFEVPYMRDSLGDAVVSMVKIIREAIPPDVQEYNIGVMLASHGTPYVPPHPEFGWEEGEIYSELIPTEDAFHEDISRKLPWLTKTGRMKYSSPTMADALDRFEEEGFTHVIVVPSAFPTVAYHTMYDIPLECAGRVIMPEEGVVEYERPSGMKIYCTALGVADFPYGRDEFRAGLEYLAKINIMEALEKTPDEEIDPAIHCPPDTLCVILDADVSISNDMSFMLYDLDDAEWPGIYLELPMPDWAVATAQPVPPRLPARLRIPLYGNLLPLAGKSLDGNRLGLAVASSAGPVIADDDPRGLSTETPLHSMELGLDFGRVTLQSDNPPPPCLPGEVCITVHADEVTGPDLKLMFYVTTDEEWPGSYLTLPTPSAVVTETVPVPDEFPIHIRIPLEGNLFTFSGDEIVGQRLGLVVVTGVAANFVVEPTDARGFSDMTLVYDPAQPLDYGEMELYIPQGNPSDINPYHPQRLTGGLLWEEQMLGEGDFVPGAIYLDLHDLDDDGVDDIIMVGEPHFEEPELPLDVLKLGVYYMNADKTVKGTEIIDAWSESDPLFYSPWGVNVIEHSGQPMVIVGCNIPGLAPLEEGTGVVLSYHRDGGEWVRSEVRSNPDPTVTNYNAMIVVSADIDNDGDEDIALSGAFESSSVGCWMENTGNLSDPWIPHLLPMHPGTDPHIRGTLAYKAADLNNDGYPEIIHNAMFDIPDTVPPRYRGEIWLAINPGPDGWDELWDVVVIDDDNWAAADMWFHDFDGDGFKDLIANQIFDSTVTRYWNPAGNLTDSWTPEVIITDLTSPSDMWLDDMNQDGLMDVCSADHTAHRGFWHENPGLGVPGPWKPNLIFRNIRLPGDFVITDLDNDGDKDWVGTSMSLGKAFIVEQVQPDSSLVTTISLPDSFTGTVTKLLVTLADTLPVMGPPVAVLAEISNEDSDGDGIGDVDRILGIGKDLTLAFGDVGVSGEYHVVVALYMEGGGVFQPVPGIDYMAASPQLLLGSGQQETTLNLELVPDGPP
jgi:protoheme ferro-lyase